MRISPVLSPRSASGDELTLTVWHEGETQNITVKLVDVNDVY